MTEKFRIEMACSTCPSYRQAGDGHGVCVASPPAVVMVPGRVVGVSQQSPNIASAFPPVQANMFCMKHPVGRAMQGGINDAVGVEWAAFVAEQGKEAQPQPSIIATH